jgi:uncharacterized C2H2 Zn-finger protein
MSTDQNSKLKCGICGASFATNQDKEDHLRLHCVVCERLFESREALLAHVKGAHATEAATAVFWDLAAHKNDDDDSAPDERDRAEYVREHSE